MLWENLHIFVFLKFFLCLSKVSFWQLWPICCAGCIGFGSFWPLLATFGSCDSFDQHILAGQASY